jgi:hypothetical protein
LIREFVLNGTDLSGAEKTSAFCPRDSQRLSGKLMVVVRVSFEAAASRASWLLLSVENIVVAKCRDAGPFMGAVSELSN